MDRKNDIKGIKAIKKFLYEIYKKFGECKKNNKEEDRLNHSS